MVAAGLWALLAASTLVIGALIGLYVPISRRIVALTMAFGAGALISALAFDLTEEAFNASNGKPYYMAGEKKVKQGPITEVWKATTTLYTQLHEGNDKTGAIVGAGVLTLGLGDLLAMVPTMHPTNTTSPAEAAETVAQFGKFFLGEIWDTYVAKAGV